jgi:diguanylate cyclase (GGDEF)-like protein
MTSTHYLHIGLLISQGMFIGFILLFLFGLRHKIGIAVVYITIGVFQHMQTALASFVYFEIAPGIQVSPGSAVLFTASLFVILLVYIREDVLEARKLIYGIILANVVLSIFTFLLGFQLEWLNAHGVVTANLSYFTVHSRILLSGTATLIIDVLLIILVYEYVAKYIQSLFGRIYSAMAVVLVVDTFFFVSGSFLGQADLTYLILSGIIGKLIMALVYSLLLSWYLIFYQRKEYTLSSNRAEIRDIFTFLTYRQKYEILKEEVYHDPLTGLFNRGFLDECLPREIETAKRCNNPMAFLMIDIDHFKHVNDEFGHQEGDRVIRVLSLVLANTVRQTDLACRYGGEEFALILPKTDIKEAKLLAHRIRQNLVIESATQLPALPCKVTITIGVAIATVDATSAEDLIAVADKRLYLGKEAGRDCIVYSDKVKDEDV